MAVADVNRARTRNNPLRVGAAAANDQIVVAQIKALKRARVEQEVAPEMLTPAGQALHKRGTDVPLPIVVRHHVGVVDRRKDRRVGIELVQRLKDSLGTTVLV